MEKTVDSSIFLICAGHGNQKYKAENIELASLSWSWNFESSGISHQQDCWTFCSSINRPCTIMKANQYSSKNYIYRFIQHAWSALVSSNILKFGFTVKRSSSQVFYVYYFQYSLILQCYNRWWQNLKKQELPELIQKWWVSWMVLENSCKVHCNDKLRTELSLGVLSFKIITYFTL